MRIENTRHWPLERIKPYFPFLLQQFAKMQKRFPEDFDQQEILSSIIEGERDLWLIFEANQVCAFLTTQLEICKDGQKRLRLLELAGSGGLEITSCLEKIEQWARQNGVRRMRLFGRLGWKKKLKKHGYKTTVLTYEKGL